jgi:hypothetical protein
MTKLMQPRQSLLDCARNEARSFRTITSTISLVGSRAVRCRSRRVGPAAGGLNAFYIASLSKWKSRCHNNCKSQLLVNRRRVIVASNFLKAKLAEMRTVVSTSYARGLICPRKGEK